jgi:hypothetical protein
MIVGWIITRKAYKRSAAARPRMAATTILVVVLQRLELISARKENDGT